MLLNDPILSHPDFSKKFTLTTDASNYALGAVLMQNNKTIAYASRTLNNHEKNYSIIEKELLAIVWATKYFRPYLFGRNFIVKTDHKPLVWLQNLKEPNSKLQRWKIKLNEFDFEVQYIKGKENVIADGLSRIEINNNELEQEDNETIHSADTDDTNFIRITEKPLNVFKNQIIINKGTKYSLKTKIIHSQKIRKTVTLETNCREKLTETMKEILPLKGTTAVFIPDLELYVIFQELYRQYFSQNKNLQILKTNKILEDIYDREIMLKKIEETHLENNHRGISEVYNELTKKVYYPKLHREIHRYINNCHICNTAKFDRHPIEHKLQLTETPTEHNQIVHIDIWYPMRNKMILTTIDRLTKYATLHELKDRTWISIIQAIKERISNLGKPKLIVTDNELDSVAIKQFCIDNNISIHFTTPYNKTGNSDIERLHGTLNEHLRIINTDPEKKRLGYR